MTKIETKDRFHNSEAAGYADLATKEPMRRDRLLWIATVIKPMPAVCVLPLQDQGRLSIEDAVANMKFVELVAIACCMCDNDDQKSISSVGDCGSV